MKNSYKALRIIILIACVCCFCFSVFSLGRYAWQTWITLKNMDSLASLIGTSTVTIPDSDSDGEVLDSDAAAMMAKYGALYDLNSDFIGWISIDGTSINYPVMFTPEDPEYYLHTSFYGEYVSSGTLFVDYRCSFNPNSTNIIIYGHHMKNGTMFGNLKKYKDEDYMKEHQTVTFDTIYKSGTYMIFTAFLSQAYDVDDDVFKYYDFINADTEEEFDSYLANIKALALYYDDTYSPEYGDEILTLSTCDYTRTDGRFVVLAKRIN